MDIFDITASALTAQRLRMDTISSNLANVNTTRKQDGSKGAYHRKAVIFAPIYDSAVNQVTGAPRNGFASSIPMRPSPNGVSIGPDGRAKLTVGIQESAFRGAGVQVVQIQDDTQAEMRKVYDPSHPDADKEGWVEMPNVNVVTEMVDMISATRAYEANVTALQSAKSMLQAALEI